MTLDSYLSPARSSPKPSDQAFVDLYCGPGGFGTSVGDYFTNAAAVDSEADPCATYRINHRSTRVYHMKVNDFLDRCVPKDFEGVTISAEVFFPFRRRCTFPAKLVTSAITSATSACS
jgi:hypothetical protein